MAAALFDPVPAMRAALLLCSALVLLPALALLLLVAPPLAAYHPFHPNHAHLPSAYLHSSLLGRASPLHALSTALVPSSYIEGWYVKLRTAERRFFAFVFFYFVHAGGEEERSTAGVMLLDAARQRSHLFTRPLAAFASSPLPGVVATARYLLARSGPSPFTSFTLHVGDLTLSPSSLQASLVPSSAHDEATCTARANLSFAPSAEALAARAAAERSASWLRPSLLLRRLPHRRAVRLPPSRLLPAGAGDGPARAGRADGGRGGDRPAGSDGLHGEDARLHLPRPLRVDARVGLQPW